MSALLLLRRQRNNPPKPVMTSFSGKTVVITGATTGLGLEAAKKIAALNADKLIITARDLKRGQNAKTIILDHVQGATDKEPVSRTEVLVESLDMSESANVIAFAKRINLNYPKIDAVILNAGTLSTTYTHSPDGWEETLQVNAISTALLGLLLLPKLLASATDASPTHLTFISSGTATRINAGQVCKSLTAGNALQAMSAEANFPGSQTQYAISKLVLEYAMRHIARLPKLTTPGGQVKVIVNSACPGMCKSDLGRQLTKHFIYRIVLWIIYTFFARTGEQGANTYVSALTREVDSQGQLWKDDKYYHPGQMVVTEQGKGFGEKVWGDLVQVIREIDPSVDEILT